MRGLFVQKREGHAGHHPESFLHVLGSIVPSVGRLGGVERLRDMLDLIWRHTSLPTAFNQTGNWRGIRSFYLWDYLFGDKKSH